MVVKWRVWRKHSDTLPSCLWFSSDTTIVLLQCYSNKLLMMCSYEIFCNTWTFLWIAPSFIKSVRWLFCMHSKTLRAICCKNPKEALFYIVSQFDGWGGQEVEHEGKMWVWIFSCASLSLPDMMKLTYGWGRGKKPKRLTRVWKGLSLVHLQR